MVKSRSSGIHPMTTPAQKFGAENQKRTENRRVCDNDDTSNKYVDGTVESNRIPMNIQHAISSNDDLVLGLGPVDHAAQILSIPSSTTSASFDEFRSQLHRWHEEGVVEQYPKGSVGELSSTTDRNDKQHSSHLTLTIMQNDDMYYGKGGMGSIPLAMRQYCLSFNGYAENYTGQSFRILQDVWVSPSNGVRYIGAANGDDDRRGEAQLKLWELWNGKKSMGKYDRLVISHNGKCADRIMSRSPAKAFHSLLRTQFAPYVPAGGGNQMTLNSIYSLVFAIKSDRKVGVDGNGNLYSPIAQALSRLSASSNSDYDASGNGVYTVLIKNEPNLRLLSCNTLKHHHQQAQNSESTIEVYTLLSSPTFGKQFKGPQENLPPELTSKVVMKLLESLERSLSLVEGSVVGSVVDLKLQLWGAAVPMNIWSSTPTTSNGNSSGDIDGFVYDTNHGVGACGDWIMDSSIAGAWESGRRLANWMLTTSHDMTVLSVGLPDRLSPEVLGKFVPSRAALEAGIGTIPSSAPFSSYSVPARDQPIRGSKDAPTQRSSPRRPNGSNKNGNNKRWSNKVIEPTQSVPR